MSDSGYGPRYDLRGRAWCDGPNGGYIAFDRERAEEVLLQYPYGPGRYAAFDAQADAFARLDHRCIPPLLDRGVTGKGLPFYTQPANVAHTRPLNWLLQDAPQSLPLRERVRILIEAGDAVRSVHEAAFLHLALSPGMIRLTTDRQVFVEGRLFHSPPVFSPIHWALDQPDPYYGAPEQVEVYRSDPVWNRNYRAEAFDGRTDVYGLGGILHSLIYGPPPITSTEPRYRAILSRLAEPRALFHVAADDERLAAQLSPIWKAALALEPGDRLPTAAAFVRELRQALWRTRP